jgi:hypothetical protein
MPDGRQRFRGLPLSQLGNAGHQGEPLFLQRFQSYELAFVNRPS